MVGEPVAVRVGIAEHDEVGGNQRYDEAGTIVSMGF
jgi:hypothetical protein